MKTGSTEVPQIEGMSNTRVKVERLKKNKKRSTAGPVHSEQNDLGRGAGALQGDQGGKKR